MEISVIIPTHNRYKFLKRALKSIFNQSFKPLEVIVVDDGSTDNTQDIILEFPSIQYIYQNNKGVSSARNKGICCSSCEWIAFLDSDDIWHKDKLLYQKHFHNKHPNIQCSYTKELWIRNDNHVNIPKKYTKYSGDIFKECLSHCIIAPSSACIHNSIFKNIGLFDEHLEVCEDYDLWLRIAAFYPIGLIEKQLITKYAGHDDQLSFKHWGMDRFRVLSLENLLLHVKEKNKQQLIINTLKEKISLLIKGAIKHNNKEMLAKYKKKMLQYS